MLFPMSYTCPKGSVSDRIATIRIGASDGLTFLYVGRLGRLGGSSPSAALMAAWTSRAAASTSRFKSN